ncbi:hypothetical protein [Yoonia sp. SS1-5]|uniref:Uncharacterized protein n=1 Tax=Yoonia rhodophyticola TaxID=3137370 RepID=A0AAN0MAB3_9RHOB
MFIEHIPTKDGVLIDQSATSRLLALYQKFSKTDRSHNEEATKERNENTRTSSNNRFPQVDEIVDRLNTRTQVTSLSGHSDN